jgi:uncharacterized protein CbrC (UPF0167 family)
MHDENRSTKARTDFMMLRCPRCKKQREYHPQKPVIGTGHLKGKSVECFKCHKKFPVLGNIVKGVLSK